ncbi:hypothetical protein BKA93DRAFT_325779 [Sparassis latifolia]|uniref:Uncharacterized protein n=1 Tax=Sparassis crispa TaxID=139825 RepID=A0A401GQC0_9APHY|nr:predicted protein [Sparassis crispa]GBE84402.1 predicted protein [Sparassis crispa]
MSKHFCFCIPVRAAVFVFSFLSFLATAIVAALAWYVTYEVDHGKHPNGDFENVTNSAKIIIIVVGSLFTLMSLMSLFGFIGSITRNRRFVESYSSLLWVIFFLSLGSSVLFLYFVYSGKNLSGSIEHSTWIKIVVTVMVIVELVLHLYIVIVVRRYVEQLRDEDAWQGPYKLTTTDVNQGLMNPQGPSYPYSDPSHSYGNV